MTSSAKNLSIDIETFSSIDLSNCGVYKYVEEPDFEVLLFGYSVDGGEVKVVDLAQGEAIPPEIIDLLKDDKVTKWAFNAAFERICLSRHLGMPTGTYLNPSAWKCTMVWSAYLGLTLSLKSVAEVLELKEQKLDEGRDLIKYFCTPQRKTKRNNRTRNYYYHDLIKWSAFVLYNLRDVEVELAIKDRLTNYPVPDFIWNEYHEDQRINDRGVLVDSKFVKKCVALNKTSSKELRAVMKEITNLENPNSVAQLKMWLEKHGIEVDSLGKKDVEVIKDKYENDHIGAAMAIRQMLAKTSTKKYERMIDALCSDGRIRGMFSFYGANRTGRFSSRIVQLQNLPQNRIDDIEAARGLVKHGNIDAIKLLYEDVPDTLSQLIRTAFVPRPGYKLIVSDFAAIEARVIAWLAGETWRIEAFANDEDIYCASASKMFGVPVVKDGINGDLRDKGKIAELALGYGGAAGALKQMGALEMGLNEFDLTQLTFTWRQTNKNITKMWWDVDKAAKEVVRFGKNTVRKTHGVTLTNRGGMLFIKLPSGRELAYAKPRVALGKYGTDNIFYYGTDSQTKKWDLIESYGPKLVENIVQGIARDLLCHAISLLSDRGIVMHVHDEIVLECPMETSVEEIVQIMSTVPPWAKGLNLKAEGFECEFYMKK
ncbi:MAG: DNA polymerase [Bacilli bacterium]